MSKRAIYENSSSNANKGRNTTHHEKTIKNITPCFLCDTAAKVKPNTLAAVIHMAIQIVEQYLAAHVQSCANTLGTK